MVNWYQGFVSKVETDNAFLAFCNPNFQYLKQVKYMKTSNIYLMRLAEWAEDMLYRVILFLSLAPLVISGYYLLVQILAWFKTAEWHWISIHQSLVDFGLIDQYFYFSVPNALGMEKLLNGILFLSAAFSYFMLAVLVWWFIFLLLEYFDRQKQRTNSYF
jgi:hypothetical protein